MKQTNDYPTWVRVSAALTVSTEQRDGVPDFAIERQARHWYVKWRTSACWSGPYASLGEAQATVAADVAYSAAACRR